MRETPVADRHGAKGPRFRPHKVGLTAAVIGLASLLFLPFASVANSRIQAGVAADAVKALTPIQLGLLLAPWLVLAVLSASRARGRARALGRGLAADACVLATLALLEACASRLLQSAGAFGRVSLGGGIWIGLFAAYAVILASRRELGTRTVSAWLVSLLPPIGLLAMLEAGRLDHLGVVVEYRNIASRYWAELLVHVELAATAIVLATAIGVGLGVMAYARPALRKPVFGTVNLLQTVPGLALIGILVGPFGALANRFPGLRALGIGGLGWAPVVFALTLYALLPVTRNTFAGLAGVSAPTLEAAKGMGMTRGQLMRRVHLPLAAPVVFTGIRTTSEQAVGNTVLGAFAAAGGLGLFIFEGLSQQSMDLIVLGSLGVAILALVVDALMRGVEGLVFGRRGGRGSVR